MSFSAIVRALWDGLLLRCPRCRKGRMFESFFKMRTACQVCGNLFEKSSGEITGGMGISIVAVLFIVIVAAVIIGVNPSIPILPALLIMGVVAIVFPILFYPISRGLWASVLYLTGDNDEPD